MPRYRGLSVIALLVAIGVTIGAASALAVQPPASITVSNVNGASFGLTHGPNWAWRNPTTKGCTVDADVNVTDNISGMTTQSSVTNVFHPSVLVNHNPVTLTLTDPTGQSTVNSIIDGDVTCELMRHHTVTNTVTTKYRAKKNGTAKNKRTAAAYIPGGDCNWRGDGVGGGISTCLWAHIAISYTFVLPKNSKFRSITHAVTRGDMPCRTEGWKVAHSGRTYHAVFHHGSVGGFSQCIIHYVAFHYSRTHKTSVVRISYTIASANLP